jgi:hypothetical protein
MKQTTPAIQRATTDAAASAAPLFPLGQIVATRGVLALFSEHAEVTPLDLIRRHVTGDFGELCADDVQANRDAIESGARVLSAYTVGGTKCYVISDAVGDDGTRTTTVLMADEY